MNLAYVTSYDTLDPHAFGGRGLYITQALRVQGFSLDYICPLEQRLWSSLVARVKTRYYDGVPRTRYTGTRDRILLKDYALQIARRLSDSNADVLFSPVSPGSQPIAYLDCSQPIVIWTDTTLAGVIGFYDNYRNLCKETIRDGMENERSALNRCSLAIYTSDWAAQIAINTYHLDESKVKVVPFGPYLECDRGLDDIKDMVASRPADKCRLLFVGMKWSRKGGDIAVNVAKKLNEAGLDTELTIAGCQLPENGPVHGFIKSAGTINKHTTVGLRELNKLMAESHLLILPTRADCAPAAIREACSFGVPCVTTDVGGIPTLVRNNLNGKLFSLDAGIEEYCTYICSLFSDYARYENLAFSTFNEYTSRLSWSVAGKSVKKLLSELVAV